MKHLQQLLLANSEVFHKLFSSSRATECMPHHLESVIAGSLLAGSFLWTYRHTTRMYGHSPTRAVQFFARASLLSGSVLAARLIVPYHRWFTVGLVMLTAVLFIQTMQTVVFRSLFNNPYADSSLIYAFFGIDTREQPEDTALDEPNPAVRKRAHAYNDDSSP